MVSTIGFIYLFRYNNYYNHKLKIANYDTLMSKNALQQYNYFVYASPLPVTFNPNDNINTQHIINDSQELNLNADYLCLIDSEHNILSKWFILKQTRNLKGQWVLTLKRDVIAENWSTIKYSPMFIERAILPSNSPFIYNLEGDTFNQIKKSETLLKDDSNCAWLCGYIARNYNGGSISFDSVVIADYKTYDLNDFRSVYLNNLSFNTFYRGQASLSKLYIKITDYYNVKKYLVGTNNTNGYFEWTWENRSDDGVGAQLTANHPLDQITSYLTSKQITYTNVFNYFLSYITDINTYNQNNHNTILSKANKYLHTINDDKDYKLTYTLQNEYNKYPINSDIIAPYLKSYIQDKMPAYFRYESEWLYESVFCTKVKLNYTEIITGTYSVTMPNASNRYTLKDAPYDIFCIPYGDFTLTYNSQTLNISKMASLRFAQGIAAQLGSNLYDLQLLPYCPMTGYTYTENNNTLTFNGTLDSKRYTSIFNSSSITSGIIFWATASSKSFDIPLSISTENLKIDNECDSYQLCSPNFNGKFAFKIAKNGGSIENINVDIMYLPYQPYIHLNPNFKGLYGQDFNDPKGLICSGDFSVSYTSEKWAEYKVQNKNFQEIFDRSIQNMDANYDISKSKAITNTLLGVGGGIASSIAGGQFGATGAIAAGMGAINSLTSLAFGKQSYEEQKSYAVDNFNLQLRNIQAIPDSITKVTAYNENNKIFPILEYYSCTDEEKNAFANKICYNSMRCGIIGTIEEFRYNSFSYGGKADKGYIKGKLIRFDGVDDFHLATEIAKILEEGIYLK